MIKGVVFDMDGVIFDSETLLTDCWVDATRADGIPDVAHTNYLCLGVNDAETKEKFLEVYGPDFPYDMYEKEVFRLFRERVQNRLDVHFRPAAGPDDAVTFFHFPVSFSLIVFFDLVLLFRRSGPWHFTGPAA